MAFDFTAPAANKPPAAHQAPAGKLSVPSQALPTPLQELAHPLPTLSLAKTGDTEQATPQESAGDPDKTITSDEAAAKQAARPLAKKTASKLASTAKLPAKKQAADKAARKARIPQAILDPLKAGAHAKASPEEPVPAPAPLRSFGFDEASKETPKEVPQPKQASPAPSAPCASAAPARGFDFSAPTDMSQALEQMGIAPPPDFDGPFEGSSHDEPGSASGGIIAPRGWGDRATGTICGMAASAFEGWPARVPAGSHYDEWIWNAMDKDGYVTVELYVDANRAPSGSVLEHAYKMPETTRPKFNPARHVLIQVPQVKHAPWGDATRVLLTPQTIRPQAKQKSWRDKPNFNTPASGTPKADNAPRTAWEPDPAGVSVWLHNDAHHGVIFGQALLGDYEKYGGQLYWVMLSRADVQRMHERIFVDDTTEAGMRFGLEGVVQTTWNDRARKHLPSMPDERVPVAPTKRYLGHWSDVHAMRALDLAARGRGPVMPEGWSRDEEQEVLKTHGGLLKLKRLKEENAKGQIAAPSPLKDMPPAPPKDPVHVSVNKMPMRRFSF